MGMLGVMDKIQPQSLLAAQRGGAEGWIAESRGAVVAEVISVF